MHNTVVKPSLVNSPTLSATNLTIVNLSVMEQLQDNGIIGKTFLSTLQWFTIFGLHLL